MAVLNVLSAIRVSQPKGVWETLLSWFSFIPDYAWRIIVFTILLKLVLSPLDFFQKYKMKKNQRITEALAPEMEKLKKQYGDDKAALQQQTMKLQRGAGFSYFAACIPMIVTLVVFFTFFAGMRNIGAYNEFKQYADRFEVYAGEYYNLTGLQFVDGLTYENAPSKTGEFNDLILEWGNNLGEDNADGIALNTIYQSYAALGADGFRVFYADYLRRVDERNFYVSNGILSVSDSETYTNLPKIKANGAYDIPYLYSFYVDGYSSATSAQKGDYDTAVSRIIALINAKVDEIDESEIPESLKNKPPFATNADLMGLYEGIERADNLRSIYIPILLNLAEDAAASAVYDYYLDNQPKFLWIKSIWIADVPWSDSVLSYSKFKSNVSKYMGSNNEGKLPSAVHNEISKKETYEKVMFKIREDKDLIKHNGFLLLAIAAIGLALLSQFITTRQQKKSGQAATAGGSMKMMMYFMPVMIGIFGVISTAAFTLYMITNSLMTLIINLLTTGVLALMGFGGSIKKDKNDSGVIKYGRKDPNDKQ